LLFSLEIPPSFGLADGMHYVNAFQRENKENAAEVVAIPFSVSFS
jgi:hypothetical protein